MPRQWALAAAFQVLAVFGVLACGVDAALVRLVHSSLPPAWNDFFGAVSEIANATVLSVATLCAYGGSRVAQAWPATRRWLPWLGHVKQTSLLMLLTLLIGGIITLTLKHVVARARPSMLIELGYYGFAAPFAGAPFNSFPSSHAFTAFAAGCVLASALPTWRRPLLVLAAIPGICRVLTLEHFPSDVLASASIASGCVRFLAPRLRGPFSRNRT
ncbi:phosphatase PAP2 family protein [Variovorax paradoxus]|uniref:phosphatase PAP2 family protein n=1 Tax=Variovorax paradoxus TaxID=34073 RepID=UPI0029C61116|nr:phosphatase PAP2 family protein [Variovorax paradoxus]WPH18082.1 phosphatase PAP2 family protein [Variovorax paradoxus]